jgi:hypothetical protein
MVMVAPASAVIITAGIMVNMMASETSKLITRFPEPENDKLIPFKIHHSLMPFFNLPIQRINV